MSAAAVVAHDPARGPGPEPLERLLLARAVAWARSVAGERVLVACPAGEAAGVTAAIGAHARVLEVGEAGLAGAVRRVYAELGVRAGEPCLLVWPRLGRLGDRLAATALEDLRAGCELVVGPVFDGGLYVLGLRGRLDLLDAVPEAAWHSGDIVGAAIGAAAAVGLDVGLLRTERGLGRACDVRAALADPLLDGELRALLTA